MKSRFKAEILAGMLLTVILAIANWFAFFEPLEVKTLDWRFHARKSLEIGKWKSESRKPQPSSHASQNIVLIPITDNCLDDLEFLTGQKKYPIPRKIHAKVVDYLSGCKASVIGFDIFFDMPSSDPMDDTDLIRSLRDSGRVVLPIVFDDRRILEDGRLVEKRQVIHCFDGLSRYAVAEGFINIKYETLQEDGIFRKTKLVTTHDEKLFPSFPLALASRFLANGISSEATSLNGREESTIPFTHIRDMGNHVTVGNRIIPRYSNSGGTCFFVNYLNQPEIPRITYGKLLRIMSGGPEALNEGIKLFKDKIVLIGPNLTGDFDFHITPFGKVPGMEIHGQVIRSILDENYLTRPPRWFISTLILGLGFLFSWFHSRANSLVSFGLTALFILVHGAVCAALFLKFSVFLPFVPPVVLALLILVTIRFMRLYMDLWRTNKSLDQRVSELSTLYDISRSISMTLITDKEKRLTLVLDKSLDSIGAVRGSIMLHDKMTDELVVEMVRGEGMGSVQATRLKPGQGVAGTVLASGQSMIINSGEKDQRFLGFSSPSGEIRQLLCIPLLVNEQPIGVVNLVNKRNGTDFTSDDEKLAATIAQQAASIIENARLYRLATIDGLTDLYVHRHFQIRLEEELRRAKRYDKHLSLMLTDIDHFKVFNDTYGHQTGDIVLQAVARVLKETVRDIDLPARYGGEEFTVILPETDIEGATILAERLRRKVETLRVPTEEFGELSVTISIGLACIPNLQVEERKELIEFADLALYRSKENGRNQVTIASQEMSKS